jgi:hypothetical protein
MPKALRSPQALVRWEITYLSGPLWKSNPTIYLKVI